MNKKFQKSTIGALPALVFFGWIFCLGLSSPAVYCRISEAGFLSSAALTVFFWRKERKADAKTSPVGMWILLTVVLLSIVFFLLLPALG
jgi:hypothetical protein